jgi:hypothetical protein
MIFYIHKKNKLNENNKQFIFLDFFSVREVSWLFVRTSVEKSEMKLDKKILINEMIKMIS